MAKRLASFSFSGVRLFLFFMTQRAPYFLKPFSFFSLMKASRTSSLPLYSGKKANEERRASAPASTAFSSPMVEVNATTLAPALFPLLIPEKESSNTRHSFPSTPSSSIALSQISGKGLLRLTLFSVRTESKSPGERFIYFRFSSTLQEGAEETMAILIPLLLADSTNSLAFSILFRSFSSLL